MYRRIHYKITFIFIQHKKILHNMWTEPNNPISCRCVLVVLFRVLPNWLLCQCLVSRELVGSPAHSVHEHCMLMHKVKEKKLFNCTLFNICSCSGKTFCSNHWPFHSPYNSSKPCQLNEHIFVVLVFVCHDIRYQMMMRMMPSWF